MGDDDVVEQRIEALERRVRELEDQRDIHHVLVAYGFAVDSGDGPGTADLYTADARTVIDHTVEIHGADGMHDMVLGPQHQAIIPGAAHVMGPLAVTVTVEGDTAVAVGYATTFTRTEGTVGVWRQSVNRWRLVREADGWRIAERDSRALDDPSAAELLRQGLPVREARTD